MLLDWPCHHLYQESLLLKVQHQDQRTNNTLLILGGAAGIRVKRFDDREKLVKVEKVKLGNIFIQINHSFLIGNEKEG